jgi:hypothetical protein
MVLFESAMMELSSLTASVTLELLVMMRAMALNGTYINEFGFFFFLRMAVAVSSFCGGSAIRAPERRAAVLTSRTSAPDGSLRAYVSSCVFLGALVASKLTLTDPPWARCTPRQKTCWWCSSCAADVGLCMWGYREAATGLGCELRCGEMVRRWERAWRLSKCEGA